MYIFLTVSIVIAAILLTFCVLAQNSKGGGLAQGFSSSNQIMGVQKTTNIVEKLTWGLMSFILVLSVVAVGLTKISDNTVQQGSEIQEQYQSAQQEMDVQTATPQFGEEAAVEEAVPATEE